MRCLKNKILKNDLDDEKKLYKHVGLSSNHSGCLMIFFCLIKFSLKMFSIGASYFLKRYEEKKNRENN